MHLEACTDARSGALPVNPLSMPHGLSLAPPSARVGTQAAIALTIVPPADQWLRPRGDGPRTERRQNKTVVRLGEDDGRVRLAQRGPDLFEVTLWDGAGAPRERLALTGQELADLEFADLADGTLELPEAFPFEPVLSASGHMGLQDLRHTWNASTSALHPRELPWPRPPVDPSWTDPRQLARRLDGVAVGPSKSLSGVADFDRPSDSSGWKTELNPHVRLV